MNTNMNKHSEVVTANANMPEDRITYQEERKLNNIQLVKDSIEEMRRMGVKITLKSLSKESGLSRQTLYAPHIQAVLNTYPEFNDKLELEHRIIRMPAQEAVDAIMRDNENLRKDLAAAKDEIKRLRVKLDNSVVRKKEYDNAVMHAMGDYVKAHLEPDKNPFVEHETEV